MQATIRTTLFVAAISALSLLEGIGYYSGGPWWGYFVYWAFHMNLLMAAVTSLSYALMFMMVSRQISPVTLIVASFFASALAGALSVKELPTIGMSSAVFFLNGLLFVILWLQQHRFPARLALVLLTIFVCGAFAPRINNAAHVWGFLLGLFSSLFLLKVRRS